MNVNTGDVYRGMNEEELKELKKSIGDSLVQVPDELADAANAELGDSDHTVVDLKGNSILANWANKERDKKDKKKKKMAKQSRKVNRK